jgi:hypothetical protein
MREPIHDCVKVEKAFVMLRHWVESWNAWCPCLRDSYRHKDECSYLKLLHMIKELQKNAGIDPHGVLYREKILEIERSRDEENKNAIPSNDNQGSGL